MMTLTRLNRGIDGIFGELVSDDEKFKCVTLEHAFSIVPNFYNPKIPAGAYPCVFGQHRLLGMNKSFETYAICAVPGATGILFHSGNYDRDSAGCVLLGEQMTGETPNRMITNSKETFSLFMNYLRDIGNFKLVVQNKYQI